MQSRLAEAIREAISVRCFTVAVCLLGSSGDISSSPTPAAASRDVTGKKRLLAGCPFDDPTFVEHHAAHTFVRHESVIFFYCFCVAITIRVPLVPTGCGEMYIHWAKQSFEFLWSLRKNDAAFSPLFMVFTPYLVSQSKENRKRRHVFLGFLFLAVMAWERSTT